MDLVHPFQHNKPLKELSTFGIGGPAKYFQEVEAIPGLQELLRYCYQHKLPFHVVGKGSNSLFDDRGFDGLVILNKIAFYEVEGTSIHVGGGFSFSLLGAKTAKLGLSGLEFASGIPASVGGAVFMNAGANGHEVGEVITEITYIDSKGDLHHYKREEVNFSYRHSSFQKMEGVIAGAKFQLRPYKEARKKQLEIIEYRTKTQPYGDKSCGCVFRNPAQGSAGALIEKCGLKGLKMGGAEVSTLHANFIVNRENATSKDVIELADYVKVSVKKQTGIELEMEIRVVPFHG